MPRFSAQRLIFSMIAWCNHRIPKRRQLLVHALPDVEDQSVAILRWAGKQLPNLRIILVVTGSPRAARATLRSLIGGTAEHLTIYRKHDPRAIYSFWRSQFVIFTHGIYGSWPPPPSQSVVNVWHGMPIKRIWKGTKGDPAPRCSWLISTSSKYSEVLAEASDIPASQIPPLGLPRNDLLFSRSEAAVAFGKAARADVGRVLLFLPTYRHSRIGPIARDGRESATALAMDDEEIARLQGMLATTRTRMLVKPHPLSVHYGREAKLSPNLWIISDAWLHRQCVTLYEALGQMDALVTDISSVYIDFLALQRPVFFYFPDLSEYRRSRTFLLEPLESWLAGPLCTEAEELMEHLAEFCSGGDRFAESRASLLHLLNPGGLGATARLFDFLRMPRQ